MSQLVKNAKIVSVQSVSPNKGSPKDEKVIQPTKLQMYFTLNPSLNNFQNYVKTRSKNFMFTFGR